VFLNAANNTDEEELEGGCGEAKNVGVTGS
jgi:hypothetical protein